VRIKTLHLTNAYHPTSGGIRTFYHAMLDAANREQRFMRLIVPGARTRVEDVGLFGRIYHVRAPRAPFVDRRYRLLLPHTYLGPGSAIRRILEREQPDVIEVCDKYSLCYLAGAIRKGWTALYGRPTLIGLSCERLDDNLLTRAGEAAWAGTLARWYIGRLYAGQFDAHVANSAYTADELHASMTTKHARPVSIVPMGVETGDLGPARRCADLRRELLQACGGDDRTTLLLYAGRLSVEKNLPLLIDTMASLADTASRTYRLIVAGDGPAASALRASAAARADGRVAFIGHVADRDRLARLYATCDIFVHPNGREPFGIGPLEAMASGTPLVAPTTGGVRAYADADCAWLAEAHGAAFAEAVRCVDADGVERDARVACARTVAARFSWARVTREIFATYDALHRARRTGAVRMASLASSRIADVDRARSVSSVALTPSTGEAHPGSR